MCARCAFLVLSVLRGCLGFSADPLSVVVQVYLIRAPFLIPSKNREQSFLATSAFQPEPQSLRWIHLGQDGHEVEAVVIHHNGEVPQSPEPPSLPSVCVCVFYLGSLANAETPISLN